MGKRQSPLTWDEWSIRARVAAVELLAAAGCGRSEGMIGGVHVDVVATCSDPSCTLCRSDVGAPRASEASTDAEAGGLVSGD